MKVNKNNRGAAVVEFAILASLLIVFLFGIFEFGFLWLSSFYIANSAREGARVAAKISGVGATEEAARDTAASAAVNRYLNEHLMFSDHIGETYDGKAFVATTYNTGSLSLTVDGETINVPTADVSVTVQTSVVWEPILWPVLDILIPGDSREIREITQSASFALE
jgi:Flp pilus assembly protein TadG